jgi:hypothetical protein
VLGVIEKDLAGAKAAFENLEKNVLPAFNKTTAGKINRIGT